MIVGITGGTGCGKTTALRAFEALGGVCLDCDEIYHELLKNDKRMLSAIESRFPGVVTGGVLDRKKLGARVFADPDALLQLNEITHSRVKAEILRRLEGESRPVAIDAIALFEGGLSELCHVTLAITAPEEERVSRLMAREGIPEEYAKSRIAAQKPQEEFIKSCQHSLHNDGTEAEFYEKCLAFFRGLGIIKESSKA